MLKGSFKTPPSPAQVEGVKFIFKNGNCGVRHSTGMGKTLLAIYAAALMLQKERVDVVYIFHVKAARVAFLRDFSKHTHLKCHVLDSEEDWDSKGRIYLVKMNTIDKVMDLIRKDGRRKFAIFDEIQYIKNPKSSIRKMFDNLRGEFSYVVGFTASPFGNRIDDLYWIMSYIVPGILGNFWTFRNKYCSMRDRKVQRNGKLIKFKEIIGYKNLDELRSKVSKFWHYESISMKKNFKEYERELTEEEEERYLEVAKGVVDGEYKDFVVRLPALQEMVDKSETKLNFISELTNNLTSEGKGVIVRFCLKAAIEDFISRIKAPTKVLTGETSDKEIKEIVKWFGPKKVLISTAAGGRSYDLHKANQIIFYSIPWEIEGIGQQVGRVARPMVSEFDEVDVHIPYIKGTIDEYRKINMEVNKDVLNSVLEGGDPNLSLEEGGIRRQTLVNMRKQLLWRLRDGRSRRTKKVVG